MSLSSPASWAAEMNFQSRYPGGIVVTTICLASCPNDEGAIHAIAPVTVTTAPNNSAIRFMVASLVALRAYPGNPQLGIPIPGAPAGPGDPLSMSGSRLPGCLPGQESRR